MGRFVKGDVVVVPFPFSDLSQAKRRPALVIAPLDGEIIGVGSTATEAASQADMKHPGSAYVLESVDPEAERI